MRAIDIASYQAGIDLARVDCDAVIIKATQGTGYVNPYYRRWTEEALERGLLVGAYHYATGAGATAEVEHFLGTVGDYLGRIVLALDWETNPGPGGHNAAFGRPDYALAMLRQIEEHGTTPIIYMSKSVCRAYNWTEAARYPLWVAQYASMRPTGWQEHPWTDSQGCGAWDAPLLHQYTSRGRVSGYDRELDLSVGDVTAEQWRALAGGSTPVQLPMITKGARGEAVRILQTRLSAAGYSLAIDGIFGPKTLAAVRHYQLTHGLVVDGIVGPKTWAALGS